MKKSRKAASSKARLIFFGNERLATAVSTDAPTLRGLVAAGYQIAAVVASHSEGVSRSRRALEIIDVAHAYHIPVMLPPRLAQVKPELEKLQAEAGILVAYGRLIPQEIIDIFPKGIINIHPSLLPKMRGSTPVETAIINGLEETGVSLMRLSGEMDAGPVYMQKALKLNGTETKQQLASKLLQAGAALLTAHLDDILNGKLQPMVQDETVASYTRQLTKQDGETDFLEPAEVIERKVRAFGGFPKVRAKLLNQTVVITRSRVAADAEDGELVVKCQTGWLEILELTAPSGRTISGADFVRGYKR